MNENKTNFWRGKIIDASTFNVDDDFSLFFILSIFIFRYHYFIYYYGWRRWSMFGMFLFYSRTSRWIWLLTGTTTGLKSHFISICSEKKQQDLSIFVFYLDYFFYLLSSKNNFTIKGCNGTIGQETKYEKETNTTKW